MGQRQFTRGISHEEDFSNSVVHLPRKAQAYYNILNLVKSAVTNNLRFDEDLPQLSIAQLIDLLSSSDLAFVARAISPWHALGVDAWIRKSRADGSLAGKGLIFAYPHPRGDILLRKEHFKYSAGDPEVAHFALPASTLREFAREGALSATKRIYREIFARQDTNQPLYIISPRIPWLSLLRIWPRSDRFISFVLTDEGIGSYVSLDVWLAAQRAERKGTLNWKERILYRLHSRLNCVDRSLFRQQDGMLALNTEVGRDYRLLLNSVRTYNEDRASSFKVAWLLTAPFVEQGYMDFQSEKKSLIEAVLLVKKKGFKVLVKPHPTESVNKYRWLEDQHGVSILRGDRSFEESFVPRARDIVIGFNSTALLTSKALFDVHPYLIPLGQGVLSDYLRQSFDHFRDITTGLVWPLSDLGKDANEKNKCARELTMKQSKERS